MNSKGSEMGRGSPASSDRQRVGQNLSATASSRLSPAVLARILWLKIGLLCFFGIVAARLVWIQVVESSKYKEIAKQQYEVTVPLLAMRGNIYDRNGKVLVSNTMTVSYAADPKLVGEQRDRVAERFARVFGKPKEHYLAKLAKTTSRFVWLERRANPQTTMRINTKQFEGLIQTDEPKRIYHYDHVAGQALGFTDIDNNGLSGVELEFDKELKGRNGYIIMQRDGLGRRRPVVDFPRVEPVNGNNIVLTIDLDMQSIAEEELRRGIERHQASGGIVVMLDVRSGEVLAMANAPSFNPNSVGSTDASASKNRAITDVFEPGSVFKIVTASAALESGLIRPHQIFFAEHGKYKPRGRPTPITDVHEYGRISFREGIELSSNIVMAKASDMIGAERLYTMARAYGFGIKTGFELPGEVSGQLKKPMEWSRTTLNTMSYGYEVGVTALQIAAAYASVSNGGILMKPYLMKQVLNANNEVLQEASPQNIRRVVSKETADTLRDFLRGVVERGTGMAAKSASVLLAGKTGTSRKIVDGKYSTSNYTASFVGIFPADQPQVVCLVMLDNPKAFGYYGAYTSAPIVKAIAEKVYATSKFLAEASAHQETGKEVLAVPDVRNVQCESAVNTLKSLGFEADISGDGAVVVQQFPAPGTKHARGETVRLATRRISTAVAEGYTVVPDLRGLALRRAINRLTMARLDVSVRGSGVVVSQSMKAGSQVKAGTRVIIECEPKRHSVLTAL